VLTLGLTGRIWVCLQPQDGRKGIDGLEAVVAKPTLTPQLLRRAGPEHAPTPACLRVSMWPKWAIWAVPILASTFAPKGYHWVAGSPASYIGISLTLGPGEHRAGRRYV
jgi:hypothetical protein